jgi:hypothetical protein
MICQVSYYIKNDEDEDEDEYYYSVKSSQVKSFTMSAPLTQ